MPDHNGDRVWARFGDFELDSGRGLLSVKGHVIKLQSQPLRVLELLVRRAPALVTREEIGDHVWGKGVHVELDANLYYCIRQIRLVLADDANSPRYLETLPKQGYRFIASVERVEPAAINAEVTASSAHAALPPTSVVAPTQSPQPVWNTRRWITLAAAAVLLLAAAIGGERYLHGRSARPSNLGPASLAILPMVNATGDPANDPLADGFTQDLIRQAVELQPLKVASRTTIFRYKGQNPDVRAVGNDLHVGMVLTERLESLYGKSAVDVELSRVEDGAIVLSRRYVADSSGHGSDLQPVKADVLRDVAQALGMANIVEADGAATTNPKAYSAFLQGLGAVRSEEPSDLQRGISDFEYAVQLDPQFSQAWGYLGEAHTLLGLYYAPAIVEMPQARKAIEQALRLDPKNPEFHGTLGLIDLVYVWDYPAAKRELSASGPQTSAFHLLSCSAHLLHETGESREAEDLVLRMAADEPGSTAVLNELGCVDYYKGDYASAVARYQEALRVDPQSPLPYWGLGKSLTQQGRYTESIVALQSFHARNGIQPPILTSEMGYAFARARRTADARRIIDDMARQRKQIFVDPFLTAVVYLGLGDRNACFHWLQEAESQRSPFLISILTDPKWSEVANDPRFIATVNRMDLAKKSN